MKTKLIIRDGHARLAGDTTTTEMPSGCLDILAQDGNTLFSITLCENGVIRVDGGNTCKHEGRILEDRPVIYPIAANVVEIGRKEYKP